MSANPYEATATDVAATDHDTQKDDEKREPSTRLEPRWEELCDWATD
jgi:hypothetical protein